MIDRRWIPLNALRAFEAVGRCASFTAGAQALSVTQSALSRHVIALEDLLGCKLIERRPQGLALTDAGAKLLPVVTRSFDRLEQVLNGITDGSHSRVRTLRVHMPPTFLAHVALPAIGEFRRQFPDIAIDIASSSVTGLPAGDLDIAVVYDKPRAGDAVQDLLWSVRGTPVCAPAVAAAHAGLPLAEFLARNELLHVKVEGEPRGRLWSVFARQAGIEVATDRGLTFDTASLAVQCAASGAGVAIADIDMFARDIAEGRLVCPYDIVVDDGYGYYLTLHPEDLTEPATALFRSWMIDRFAQGAGTRPPAAARRGPAFGVSHPAAETLVSAAPPTRLYAVSS